MAPSRRFKFSLQPKLDSHKARRDELVLELDELRSTKRRQEEELRKHLETMKKVAQRVRQEADNLISRPNTRRETADLIAGSRWIEDLRKHQNALAVEETEHRERIRETEGQIRVKQNQLSEVIDEITAFERLREKQLDLFRKEILRQEEKERDDDAILRWNRGTD